MEPSLAFSHLLSLTLYFLLYLVQKKTIWLCKPLCAFSSEKYLLSKSSSIIKTNPVIGGNTCCKYEPCHNKSYKCSENWISSLFNTFNIAKLMSSPVTASSHGKLKPSSIHNSNILNYSPVLSPGGKQNTQDSFKGKYIWKLAKECREQLDHFPASCKACGDLSTPTPTKENQFLGWGAWHEDLHKSARCDDWQ